MFFSSFQILRHLLSFLSQKFLQFFQQKFFAEFLILTSKNSNIKSELIKLNSLTVYLATMLEQLFLNCSEMLAEERLMRCEESSSGICT